jgi:hypothetical protein
MTGKCIIVYSKPVLRIRIRFYRIHMFLGITDPDPDPLARGMNPDPPFVINQAKKVKKNLDSYCVLFSGLL